jgi:hypothetical protein
MLYEHRNCSEFISDLLTFIKDRLLRVGPGNRADSKEIVEKFAELHRECLNDQDYCTKRFKKIPQRTGSGLSELAASSIHLSKATTDRIDRKGLPEHTGPLEDDLQLSSPSDTQLPITNLYTIDRGNYVVPGGVQLKSKGKSPGRSGVVWEDDTSTPTPTVIEGAVPNAEEPPVQPKSKGKSPGRSGVVWEDDTSTPTPTVIEGAVPNAEEPPVQPKSKGKSPERSSKVSEDDTSTRTASEGAAPKVKKPAAQPQNRKGGFRALFRRRREEET